MRLISVRREKGRVGLLRRYGQFLVGGPGGHFNEVIECLFEEMNEGAGDCYCKVICI